MMELHNHNFMRLWGWQQAAGSVDTGKNSDSTHPLRADRARHGARRRIGI
jgi:hypothetical protein